MTNKQENTHTYRGKAAFHLFELDDLQASTTVRDLTRQAVALREAAAAAKTRKERDELRMAAEGCYLEAQQEIVKEHGHSALADDIDDTVWKAISSIQMP